MRIFPTLNYPRLPGQQFLCIIDTQENKPAFPDRLGRVHWTDLSKTVIAGAFLDDCEVVLNVNNKEIVLPKLLRRELFESKVVDQYGNNLGVMVHVPALFVHANNIIYRQKYDSGTYDYARALKNIALETGRLAASALNSVVFSNREPYGFYGPAICSSLLEQNEVAITAQFASKIVRQVAKRNRTIFGNALTEDFLKIPLRKLTKNQKKFLIDFSIEVLDGFPTWSTRYPLSNRYGVSPKVLRVIEGRHQAVIVNPDFLVNRYLGDADGDQIFVKLRVEDVCNNLTKVKKLPAIDLKKQRWDKATSRLSLDTALDPTQLPGLSEKQKIKWFSPELKTTDERIQAIRDADTRTHVAVYTIMAWWVCRVLVTKAGYDFSTACRLAFDVLEWYMESAMDARKGGSAMSMKYGFNPYEHMNVILYGGKIDWLMLEKMGMPKESLSTLKLAWTLANNNLRRCCGESPVYTAVVLRRRSPTDATTKLFALLNSYGYNPEEVTSIIVNDLMGLQVVSGSLDEQASPLSELSEFYAYVETAT